MRVKPSWLTNRMQDMREERGAIAVIVALSLAGLLGMLVLVVDLGGMLTMRRRVVASADSAALAAAQSCARQLPGEAQSQANTFAVDNETKVVSLSFSSQGCTSLRSSGTVNVKYRAPVDLQFAPVLGLPAQANVDARATAEWGPAGGGIGPLPIVISLDGQRRIPCVWQTVNTACNYWYDNGASGFNNMSNWGFINLEKWGVGSGDSCPSAGTSQRRDWIGGIGVPELGINETGPTYVCADSGHSTPSWFDALASLVGSIRYFPVNDPAAMILQPSGKEKYDIVGFTALKIAQVLRGDDPAAIGTPGVTRTCTVTVSFSSGSTLNLDGVSGAQCPGGTRPDSLGTITLSKGNGSRKVVYQPGVDYTYTPDVITWIGPPKTNVKVTFDWTTGGTAGACGSMSKDPNAVCLVATWQGAQVGGTRPSSTGQDFGVRAIRLSD